MIERAKVTSEVAFEKQPETRLQALPARFRRGVHRYRKTRGGRARDGRPGHLRRLGMGPNARDPSVRAALTAGANAIALGLATTARHKVVLARGGWTSTAIRCMKRTMGRTLAGSWRTFGASCCEVNCANAVVVVLVVNGKSEGIADVGGFRPLKYGTHHLIFPGGSSGLGFSDLPGKGHDWLLGKGGQRAVCGGRPSGSASQTVSERGVQGRQEALVAWEVMARKHCS